MPTKAERNAYWNGVRAEKRRTKRDARKCTTCGVGIGHLYCNATRCKECLRKYRAFKSLERVSQKKGLVSDLTQEQWKETLEMYNYMCVYCCAKDEKLTKEHVVPVTKGGGYTQDNIVPACQSCNSSKGNNNMIYWMGTR